MNEIITEPIERLRIAQRERAKTERGELLEAFKTAIQPDIEATEKQGRELEDHIIQHAEWIAANIHRIEAILPRSLAALSTYEQTRDRCRNQISTVLDEAARVSVNVLWGANRDGSRDPSAYTATLAATKLRLGQTRGSVNSLDAAFFQIGIELAAMEKRGYGLPQK
jgi:hypothetical protein